MVSCGLNIKFVTYSKHIRNPVRCETANAPDTRGDGDGVNVLILQIKGKVN